MGTRKSAFNLNLREDRQTPRHASYVLRFTNDEGRQNRNPVKHAINVDRDLQPEAEIRLPQEKVRDVRLDEKVAIEVEANDPDFALGAVRLRGETAGQDVLNEPLLNREQSGRFNRRYELKPSAHGLKAGDVLEYWVEADDNRKPKPNTVATEHKSLRIIAPDPAQQPPPNGNAQGDRQQKDASKTKARARSPMGLEAKDPRITTKAKLLTARRSRTGKESPTNRTSGNSKTRRTRGNKTSKTNKTRTTASRNRTTPKAASRGEPSNRVIRKRETRSPRAI